MKRKRNVVSGPPTHVREFLAEFPYMQIHLETLQQRTPEQIERLAENLRSINVQLRQCAAASADA